MTTIAYKDGKLAYDSRITEGDEIVAQVNKGIKTDKYLCAVSGDAAAIPHFKTWLLDNLLEKKMPKALKKMSYTAVVVDTNGVITVYSDDYPGPMQTESKVYAAGTGRAYAYGAMHVGSSARDAVIAAAAYDTNTGGRVYALSF